MHRRLMTILMLLALILGIAITTDLFGIAGLIRAALGHGAHALGHALGDSDDTDHAGLSISSATRVPDGTLDADQARAALATVTVAEPGPMTGYSPQEFGPDTCATKETVLRRDGVGVQFGPGCATATGSWYSPYDATVHTRGEQVAIDRVTSLEAAWRAGASGWAPQQRLDYARDPRNLLAVSASSAAARGGRDADSWQPPRIAYRCPFARIVITVKSAYRLSVTARERAALEQILQDCGTTPLPLGAAAPGTARP